MLAIEEITFSHSRAAEIVDQTPMILKARRVQDGLFPEFDGIGRGFRAHYRVWQLLKAAACAEMVKLGIGAGEASRVLRGYQIMPLSVGAQRWHLYRTSAGALAEGGGPKAAPAVLVLDLGQVWDNMLPRLKAAIEEAASGSDENATFARLALQELPLFTALIHDDKSALESVRDDPGSSEVLRKSAKKHLAMIAGAPLDEEKLSHDDYGWSDVLRKASESDAADG